MATSEVAYAPVESTLNRALSFVGRAAAVYWLGSPQVRQLSNQFFFEEVRISVDDDGEQITAPVAREPWSPCSLPASPTAPAETLRTSTLFRRMEVRKMMPWCPRQDSNLRTRLRSSFGR